MSDLPALAQMSVLNEMSPPTSMKESLVPIDFAFKKPPAPMQAVSPFKDQIKEELRDLPPFLRGTTFNLNPRTLYFYQDNFDKHKKEAWAMGGALAYKSGYLGDRLAVGAVGYTSQPIYAPGGRDGTRLLKPGQEGITVLGQVYGEIKLAESSVISLFRKEYETPYINKNDTRMIPNTFEAYGFRAQIGGNVGEPCFRFGGGYFTKIKERDSSSFIPMSRAAGVKQDRGVGLGGGIFEMENFSVGALNYYSQDLINIFYAESKFTLSLKNGLSFQLAGQFTDQESTGDNLLKNRPFSTRQFGIKGGGSYQGAMLSLAYTINAIGGADLQFPWSSYPGYTGAQVIDFNRAGEQALLIMGTYALSRLGLKEVTAYALWVHGWHRVDPISRKPAPNDNEYDFDLQWRPQSNIFKGIWLRLRYAVVEQRGGKNQTLHEMRAILNYNFSLL